MKDLLDWITGINKELDKLDNRTVIRGGRDRDIEDLTEAERIAAALRRRRTVRER